jgi:hypothetical protein
MPDLCTHDDNNDKLLQVAEDLNKDNGLYDDNGESEGA